MKLSTRTRYGMRLMVDLAQHWGEGYIALKDVAERQNISKKYLEQIVSLLMNHGLLMPRACTGKPAAGAVEAPFFVWKRDSGMPPI